MALIKLIVVHGKNREIGKDNQLLWKLPKDMQRFKQLTTGNIVVMGRKTYQSIGKPLEKRTNIVITSQSLYDKNITVCHNKTHILKLAELVNTDIFIIGGQMIYEQFLPFADFLYITEVDDTKEADTFFPDYSRGFRIIHKQQEIDNGYNTTFKILENINKITRKNY